MYFTNVDGKIPFKIKSKTTDLVSTFELPPELNVSKEISEPGLRDY